MKKIDILNSALAESGLTAEAVVKSWYEDNQISAEFLQQLCPVGGKTTFQDVNLIPSKKFVTPKKVEPGMFYYADGDCRLCRQEPWVGFGIAGNCVAMVERLALCRYVM